MKQTKQARTPLTGLDASSIAKRTQITICPDAYLGHRPAPLTGATQCGMSHLPADAKPQRAPRKP